LLGKVMPRCAQVLTSLYTPSTAWLATAKAAPFEQQVPAQMRLLPSRTAGLILKAFGADHPPTTNTLYIDSPCHTDGLLEHWIETTSEVVSILIGYAAGGLSSDPFCTRFGGNDTTFRALFSCLSRKSRQIA